MDLGASGGEDEIEDGEEVNQVKDSTFAPVIVPPAPVQVLTLLTTLIF